MKTKVSRLFIQNALILLTAIVAVGCSNSANFEPHASDGKTDVTDSFLATVAGKSYGPNERYRFTKDRRFIKKVSLKAMYSADDKLPDGRKVGADGSLLCNFIVDARLNRVTLNQRLPSWDLGPYELELSDERVSLNPVEPFSNNGLSASIANAVCNHRFKKARLVEEIRIPNQYMHSFSSSQIQWSRDTGQFESVFKITDLARGETLDLTEDAIRELAGEWKGDSLADATEALVVSKEARSIALTLFVAPEVKGVFCLAQINGRIASVRMNSEKRLVVQLHEPKLEIKAVDVNQSVFCQEAVPDVTAPSEISLSYIFSDSLEAQAAGWSSRGALIRTPPSASAQ